MNVANTGLVERIYEAAVVPELWPDVFEELALRTDSALGSMFAMRDGAIRWVGTEAANRLIAEYAALAHAAPNPRTERGRELGRFGFGADQDLFDLATLKDEPFYRDFLYPRGYGWFAGTLFMLPTGDLLVLSVERRFERGPFERRFLDDLDALRPHLGRAALLSARLNLERARAMTQALESVGLPAAVLRRGGRPFAVNPLFESLIPSLAVDARERLRLVDAGADRLLESALGAIGFGADAGVRSIPVPADGQRLPSIVHVIPVCGAAHDIFSQAVAMIVVTEVDRSAVPTADVLQGLFDLTPAEARVAHGVAGAQSIEALADTLGVARETVRTQLKAVLAKTGLNRQAELANLLAGLALPR